jgi:hypothetical protein
MGALTGKVGQVGGIATEVLVLVNEKTHKTPFYYYLDHYLAFKPTVNVLLSI